MRLSSLLLIALLAGCGQAPSETLPDELLGVWRTSAPGYEDRSLELRTDLLFFGTGEHSAVMHPIQKVTSSDARGGRLYTIEYLMNGGDVLSVDLLHTPGRRPHLKVGQQPALWVPEAQADWLTKKDAPS